MSKPEKKDTTNKTESNKTEYITSEDNADGKPWTTRPEHNPEDRYCDCVDCYRWKMAKGMAWRGAPEGF